MAFEEFVGTLVIGLLLGWFFTTRHQEKITDKATSAAWAAIKAEAEECSGLAVEFRRAEIRSPQYRLPTLAYETCLPVLINHGKITEIEARELSRFYGFVTSLNLGIESTNTLLMEGNMKTTDRFYDRNNLKAQHIIAQYDRNLSPLLEGRLGPINETRSNNGEDNRLD